MELDEFGKEGGEEHARHKIVCCPGCRQPVPCQLGQPGQPAEDLVKAVRQDDVHSSVGCPLEWMTLSGKTSPSRRVSFLIFSAFNLSRLLVFV